MLLLSSHGESLVPVFSPVDFNFCRNTLEGFEYVGKMSRTASGKRCQRWDASEPHEPSGNARRDENFPDGSRSLAKNYCRNPDSSSGGPWCYTSDPDIRREYCNIPYCRRGSFFTFGQDCTTSRECHTYAPNTICQNARCVCRDMYTWDGKTCISPSQLESLIKNGSTSEALPKRNSESTSKAPPKRNTQDTHRRRKRPKISRKSNRLVSAKSQAGKNLLSHFRTLETLEQNAATSKTSILDRMSTSLLIGGACQTDIDCASIPLTICSSGTCKCIDGTIPSINNYCRPISLGMQCPVSAPFLCQSHIPNSICDSSTMTCKCMEGFVQDDWASCVPGPTIGSLCKTQEDCDTLRNAYCNQETGTCECKDGNYQTSKTTCEVVQLGMSCPMSPPMLCESHIPNSICNGSTLTCTCQAGYRPCSPNDCCPVQNSAKRGYNDVGIPCPLEGCASVIPNSACDANTGKCRCNQGYREEGKQCVGVLGSTCDTLLKPCCALVQNSICNQGTCECIQGYTQHDGQCFLPVNLLGTECRLDSECAGVQNATCFNEICECEIETVQVGHECFLVPQPVTDARLTGIPIIMDDCETGSFYSMLSTTYEQGDCTIKSIRVNATITGFHHSDLGLYLVRGNNIVTLLHLVGGTCPVVRGEYSFSDLAPASPTTAAICEGSPFEFRPQRGSLSDFAGLPVSGNWAVFLQDTSACDPVGLHDLKIIVNEEHVVRLNPQEFRPVKPKKTWRRQGH